MNTTKTILVTLMLALFGMSSTYAQVGIGTTEPHASSILDVTATDKGFLPPRMTDVQRTAIAGPTSGLTIYNTEANCLQWYDGAFWFDACTKEISAVPNSNLTAATPTYQGESVINSTGIGYNGETVPAASTITVQLSNTSATPQEYGLLATHPATGLQYSATGTIAGSVSNEPVILTHNEVSIPWQTYGVITMLLQGTSSTLNLVPRIDIKSIPATETQVTDVDYGTQTWMDRNLGARRVANAINDVLSYGNYYQWGRPADGHEIGVWNGANITDGRGFENTTATLASDDAPGHPNFITTSSPPYDWRSGNNDNRWATANQGPCPPGYHVPTRAQWVEADAFGAWDNNTDIYESALKLPSAGNHFRTNLHLSNQGTQVNYWSSTVESANARFLSATSAFATGSGQTERANGHGVRCIKD